MKSIFYHTYNAAQLTNKKHRFSEPIDLTSGTPWKVILKYSLPIMLSYLLQQIYVLTDAVICGQTLSADEIAGVNDTFALTFIFAVCLWLHRWFWRYHGKPRGAWR